MNKIKHDGLQIYEFEGAGTPLIFVHAFPLNGKMWKEQWEYFKDKYQVISYDVRGLGESRSINNQFTMEKYVDDFLSIINLFEFDKVIACGLSMGGYILLRSYLKSPDKFKALILADTKAERDDDNSLINRSNVINNILDGKRNEFIKSFIQKLISKKSYENHQIKNFIESIVQENTDEGICGAQLALGTRTNTIDHLKSFNVPSLIMVGEDDELTPLSSSEKMHKLIKGSELKIIKDSGHLSNIENPEVFNAYVDEFLNKNI